MIHLNGRRRLERLTPRQLRTYYEVQVRKFFLERMTWSNGRRSKTAFESRHDPSQFCWWGRPRIRENIRDLKAIRQMLRDGYDRKVPKTKVPVGACAIVPQERIRDRKPPKEDRR